MANLTKEQLSNLSRVELRVVAAQTGLAHKDIVALKSEDLISHILAVGVREEYLLDRLEPVAPPLMSKEAASAFGKRIEKYIKAPPKKKDPSLQIPTKDRVHVRRIMDHLNVDQDYAMLFNELRSRLNWLDPSFKLVTTEEGKHHLWIKTRPGLSFAQYEALCRLVVTKMPELLEGAAPSASVPLSGLELACYRATTENWEPAKVVIERFSAHDSYAGYSVAKTLAAKGVLERKEENARVHYRRSPSFVLSTDEG